MGNWSKEEAIACLRVLKEEQEKFQKEMEKRSKNGGHYPYSTSRLRTFSNS